MGYCVGHIIACNLVWSCLFKYTFPLYVEITRVTFRETTIMSTYERLQYNHYRSNTLIFDKIHKHCYLCLKMKEVLNSVEGFQLRLNEQW